MPYDLSERSVTDLVVHATSLTRVQQIQSHSEGVTARDNSSHSPAKLLYFVSHCQTSIAKTEHEQLRTVGAGSHCRIYLFVSTYSTSAVCVCANTYSCWPACSVQICSVGANLVHAQYLRCVSQR